MAKTKESSEADKVVPTKSVAEQTLELEAEAKTLGIKPPKVGPIPLKVKDRVAEQQRRDIDYFNWLETMIATKKADAKLDIKEQRKRLLETRLTNPQQYPKEQLQHFRAELKAIETGKWFPPERQSDGTMRVWRLPPGKTAIDVFLNT